MIIEVIAHERKEIEDQLTITIRAKLIVFNCNKYYVGVGGKD
jgi:hypothetical protein